MASPFVEWCIEDICREVWPTPDWLLLDRDARRARKRFVRELPVFVAWQERYERAMRHLCER